MDWIANGVRLLGLGVLGVWEYWLFKQRRATRTSKLRAKQIDGATAVMEAITTAYIAAKQFCGAPHLAGDTHQTERSLPVTSAYDEAVATYHTWLAFLPTDINDNLARFLQSLQTLITNNQPNRQALAPVQQAYIDLIASVRQHLGEAPLNQQTRELLEQPPPT